MERIEKTIEVDCPVHTVYNQWTQFEDFPKFMAGVKEVRQLDDTHLHWRAEVWGKDKEWDSEITEQEPDERISWRSVGDAILALNTQVEASVEDFKQFIEARGSETGAWRGEVSDGEPRRSSQGRWTESEEQDEETGAIQGVVIRHILSDAGIFRRNRPMGTHEVS